MVDRDRRVGRPPLAGDRYPSGRRKPEGDPRGSQYGMLTHRIRDAVARWGLDPRVASELALLGPEFAGELTSRQVETGDLVARIYAAYERDLGKRRSAASPSYMRTYAHRDEDVIPADIERRMRQNRRRYDRIQEVVNVLPAGTVGRAREALELLCVENYPISSTWLPGIRALLDRIAAQLGRGEKSK